MSGEWGSGWNSDSGEGAPAVLEGGSSYMVACKGVGAVGDKSILGGKLKDERTSQR